MTELQFILNGIANNGSWSQAILYAIGALILFAVVSFIARSIFAILLGVVIAFYTFNLNLPDTSFSSSSIAAGNLITSLENASTCAADHISDMKHIGVIIRNGDVMDIAKKCDLFPK